jgi:PAS domain S-box-containing protein
MRFHPFEPKALKDGEMEQTGDSTNSTAGEEPRSSPAATEQPRKGETGAEVRPQQLLKALIIEDSMTDAELEIRQLRKSGFEVSADVVDSRETFLEKIRSKPYDVVLADYQLPHWTGDTSVELLKKEGLEIPVILVTGALGDELAADFILRGVTNYVLKQRLERLPHFVRTALAEKTLHEQAKRAEEERARLAAIVESSEDAITGETLEGVITSWNGAAQRLYGYAPEEAVGQLSSIVVPQERSPAEEEAREALRQGAHVAHLETVRVRKDGTKVNVSATFSTIRDREGRIIGLSTIARDITELKRTQDALRHANAYNRSLIETGLDPLIIIGLDGKVTDLNSAAEEVSGYSRSELIGIDFTTYFTEPERALAGFRLALQEGSAHDYELEVRHRDGHVTPLLCNGTVLRDESGEVAGVLATGRDITERKRAEQQLQLQAAALASAANGIVITNREGQIIWVNPAAAALTGYSAEEVMGQNPRLLKSGRQDTAFYKNLWDTITAGRVWHGEIVNRRKDGTLYPEEMTITPVHAGDDEITHFVAVKQDITERKRAEEALQAERQRLFGVLETLPAMICLLTPDYHVAFANRSFREKLGGPGSGHCYEIIYGLTAPCDFCEAFSVLKTGQAHHWEARRPDGGVIEVHDFPFTDVDGSPMILEMDIDITESKKAKEALEKASAYNRSLLEASLDPLVTIAPDGKITDVNTATETATGRSRQELVGSDFSDYFTEPERARAVYRQVFSGEWVRDYELEIRHRDGHLTPVLYNASVYRDEKGNVAGVVAAARDITERKRAQEDLSASEARYRRLFERSQDGILVVEIVGSKMGRITDVNPAALRMLESTPDRVLGKRLWELEAFSQAGATPETFRDLRKGDLVLLPKSGKPMDVEFMAIAYHVGEKDVIQCSLRDVTLRRQAEQDAKALNDVLEERVAHRTEELATLNEELAVEVAERKEAEEALQKLQRQAELILNSAGEAIFRIGLDGTCTFANPAAARIFGYSRGELLGQNVHALCEHRLADGTPCPPEDCQVQKALKQGLVEMSENQIFKRRDGASIWMDSVTAPMTEAGEIVGAVQILHDVSERRALEKMKDEFVSVVSHELRTPLTAIRGALGLLAKGTLKSQPARAQHLLELATSNADRLTRLINDILDSARLEHGGPPLVRKLCEASELVAQAVDLMRPMAEAAGLAMTVNSDSFSLSVDPDAILQVLTNLLSNAIKFSPSGSEVRVEVARDDVRAVFRVIDHGQGIPADKLKSIFGRFQTVDASDTRKRGGSGLGLFICRGIVQRHGGKIWAESKPGSGSTLVFTLPLSG